MCNFDSPQPDLLIGRIAKRPTCSSKSSQLQRRITLDGIGLFDGAVAGSYPLSCGRRWPDRCVGAWTFGQDLAEEFDFADMASRSSAWAAMAKIAIPEMTVSRDEGDRLASEVAAGHSNRPAVVGLWPPSLGERQPSLQARKDIQELEYRRNAWR